MWNSITQYHPRVGFTMMPNVKSRIASEVGGYLVRTNSAGFRSDCEFVKERSPGKFRAILFGDSQTAGDCCSNPDRYSDVVEKLVPDLEVYNYGLPGTGTDQHYLVYQDCAHVEHDLVIVGMHVENIVRASDRFFPFHDQFGKETIYAKPYFAIEGGKLALHHIPVPKAPLRREEISAEDAPYVHSGVAFAGLRNIVKKLGMRDLMQKITKFQPLPEYDDPKNPKWVLLRRILQEWIRESQVPVLLFLLPLWPYIEESSDPTNYLARYRELAEETGCYVHDPLPDLWKYTAEERRAFRFKVDSHFTRSGHRALAASLAPVIERIRAESRAKG